MLGGVDYDGFAACDPCFLHSILHWVWGGYRASMFLGNIVCAIVNIPMASLLVRVLAIKPTILYPLVLVMAFMGVYTVNFSTGDFVLMIMFGVIGYFMKKYKVPTGPMILASDCRSDGWSSPLAKA